METTVFYRGLYMRYIGVYIGDYIGVYVGGLYRGYIGEM